MNGTCHELVSDGMHFHPCGRKVKADGLCGMHLGVRDRRIAKRNSEAEKEQASRQTHDEVAALLGELGIEGTPEYSSRDFRYTGRVIVSQETLRKLAAR